MFLGLSAYNVSRSLFIMLQRLIHLQYNVRVHAQKIICVTIVAIIAKAANFLIAHNIGGLVVFFTLFVAYRVFYDMVVKLVCFIELIHVWHGFLLMTSIWVVYDIMEDNDNL